jgi:hypothetical protein
MFIVDKQAKAYTEMPFRQLTAGSGGGQVVSLKNTGKTRNIANQPCREYQAAHRDAVEQVLLTACVSTTAPGAKEMTRFESALLSRLVSKQDHSTDKRGTASITLERESTTSVRVPDLSARQHYVTASSSSKTQVQDIKLQPLTKDVFEPPKGFAKIEAGTIPQTPKTPENTPSGPATEQIAFHF